MMHALRSGSWLTGERQRFVCLALLLVQGLVFGFLLLTANGNTDRLGRPLGTDFSNVFAAGTYVLQGNMTAPFDPALHYLREQEIFGKDTLFYGWHYPPFFLFIAAVLALLPYVWALAAWQVGSFIPYLLVMRRLARNNGLPEGGSPKRLCLLAAACYPAVFVNLGHGHNGFLSAALLGGFLLLLQKRPMLAGFIVGLLAYKPQFGVMVPVALLARRHWRAVAGGALSLLFLVLATTAAFGTQVWPAFLASTAFTRTVVLEQGGAGWYKIQSVFSWVRMWGGAVESAYIAQAVCMLMLAVTLGRLWRNDVDFRLKAAALCIASVLSTPYALDYDTMLLAPAILLFALHGLERGFLPWEKTALACLWLVPLIGRTVAEIVPVPVGVIAMFWVYGLIVFRGRNQMEW